MISRRQIASVVAFLWIAHAAMPAYGQTGTQRDAVDESQAGGVVEPQSQPGQAFSVAPSIPQGRVTQPVAASTDVFGLNADERTLLKESPPELARHLREKAILAGIDIISAPEPKGSTDFAIHTEGGAVSPRAGAHHLPANKPQGQVVARFGQVSPYIVQFSRPVSTDEWLQLLELGCQPLDSVSGEALVYLISDSTVNSVTSLPFVRWVGAWMPEYKLNSARISVGRPDIYVRPLGRTETEYLNDLTNLGFPSASEIESAHLYTIPNASDKDIRRLASLWWVKAVFRAPKETMLGTVNFGAMDSRMFLNSPWLNAQGYNGTGVSVGVRDDGVNSTHDDLNGIFLVAPSDLTGQADHGTHVTGIVAGRGKDSISSPITGVAPGSLVLFRNTQNSSFAIDLDTFVSNSVEISNHSYAFADCSDYDSDTEIYDNNAHDHARLLIVAAGNNNDGYDASCDPPHPLVTNPALGKNTIAVGAISYTFDGTSQRTDGTGGLGNITVYSSRGPSGGTYKRLKPELVAPGGDIANCPSNFMYGVVSVNGHVGDKTLPCQLEDAVWPDSDEEYLRKSGTSMAAPHVTGALALMRQWSPPSSSSSQALKAQLIAQAIPLRGQESNTPLNGYADTTYGYGLVNPQGSVYPISGEWSPLLWTQDTLTSIINESSWSFVPPLGTQKIVVALAYDDADTPDGSLRDNLEFEVDPPPPSQIAYSSDPKVGVGCTNGTTCIKSPWPADVNTESPIKKLVIEDPSPADLGQTWTVRVRFTQWPSWCRFPCIANENFGLVVEGIYKQPALALQLSQTSFAASPGQPISIPVTVTNTGGYIIPAVGIWIDGTTPRVSKFLGPLIGQNSSKNDSLTLVAPSGSGNYTYTIKAMGVNRGLEDAQPATLSVTVGPPPLPTPASPGSATLPYPIISTTTPTFQWSGGSGADLYGLYVSKYPYGGSDLIYQNESIPGGQTSLLLPAGHLNQGVAYRWNMRAHNSAGWSNYSGVLYFQVADTTPPTNVVVTTPTSGQTISGTFTLQGTAQDNSGTVQELEFYIDSDSGPACSDTVPKASGSAFQCNWDTTAKSNGPHTVYGKAWDWSENSTNSSSVSFTISNNPVTYTISGQVTLNGSGLGGVVMSLIGSSAGSTVTNGSGNYYFTNLGEGGTYTVIPSLSGYTFNPPSQTFQNLSGTVAAYFTASRGVNPVPSISQPLIPTSAIPGGASFTLTVNGTGFVPASVVQWNGAARTTTYVSSILLTATVLSSDIATASTAWITVVSPPPGVGTSNVAFLPITNPTTSISLGRSDIATGIGPRAVTTGDFNGDGKLDLAVANLSDNSVSVLLGKGDGTFQAAVDYTAGSAPTFVAVGDFNGDGKPDLAVANNHDGNVSVLLGDGDGTFQAAVSYGAGSYPASVAVGDFNGDGKPDLAVANSDDNNVSVLLGRGDGTFQTAVNYATGSVPLSVAVGDFNGDGKPDLAVANHWSDNVSVLLGNGDGTFQAAMNYTAGSYADSVAVGDFNADGKPDLAVTNYYSDNVSVLLGRGDGTFQAAVNYATGSVPLSVAAGDFNGDGKPDLVVVNVSDNSVSVLLGNGDGTFQPMAYYAVGLNPTSVAVGDFNGDGRLDMAVANLRDNTVSVLLQTLVVSLSSSSLTFADQPVGTTSPPQTVTLTNGSSAPLSISSIAVTGTNAGDYAQANTCPVSPSTLQVGANCTISVTFTPTATGTRTGNLTITDNAPGSPQIVSLSGTGTAPVASVSPASLTFGAQNLGTTSPPQTVALSNTGTAPLSVSSIVASGDFGQTSNCVGPLAAGASCNIAVTFTPAATGTRTGTLTIADNAANSPQSVPLTGTGINPSGAGLSPTSLSFYYQVINTTSAAKKVTLTSTGTTNLSISSIAVAGTNAGDFAETYNCPASMAPGAKCTINVKFTPTALGARTATLAVTDNAANSPQTVALSGTGQAPVVLSPTSLSFGSVSENSPSASKTIKLTNNQAVALTISGITLSNPDYTETDTCHGSVAAKGNCTISVTLRPSALGADNGTMSVNDNASNSPQTATLTGTGVVPAKLSAASLSFGSVPQSTASTAKNLTFYNYEAAALSITSITTGNPDFTETNTCAGSVPAKGHCVITVRFTPSIVGAETGTLRVTDAASNSPQTATLTGTGIVQAKVSPTSLTFTAQTVGTTSTARNVTLTNNLSTALTISITFTGAVPGDFAQTNTCGASLAAKSHCAISVKFTPAATGSRTATMNVNDSANNSPQTVSLTGTGK